MPICIHCRKEFHDEQFKACNDCREKKASYMRNFRDRQEVQCKGCGVLHSDKKENGQPFKFCCKCRATLYQKVKGRYRDGKCRWCSNEAVGGHTYCEVCREKNANTQKLLRSSRMQSGKCVMCGAADRSDKINRCSKCVLKETAQRTVGSRSRYLEIGQLFEDQMGRCAYTGRELELGVNASLDHKYPVCLGGTHDLSNLQWVHSSVNFMKGKLTEEEFLLLVTAIKEHLDSVTHRS